MRLLQVRALQPSRAIVTWDADYRMPLYHARAPWVVHKLRQGSRQRGIIEQVSVDRARRGRVEVEVDNAEGYIHRET